MVSGKLVPSEHFYGTGESFLYTFYPSFKVITCRDELGLENRQLSLTIFRQQVFKWTGENNFFTKGNSEGVYFGAGE